MYKPRIKPLQMQNYTEEWLAAFERTKEVLGGRLGVTFNTSSLLKYAAEKVMREAGQLEAPKDTI